MFQAEIGVVGLLRGDVEIRLQLRTRPATTMKKNDNIFNLLATMLSFEDTNGPVRAKFSFQFYSKVKFPSRLLRIRAKIQGSWQR